jgi:acyl-CoA thioester hydrolase
VRDPARITIRRLVEYPDTDASGHYQHAIVLRWVEAAEAVLHGRLGIAGRTFGSIPRLHLEIDYRVPLRFLEEGDVDLRAAHVGRTAVRWGFAVRRGEALAAEGHFVAAYVPAAGAGSVPWPDDIRRAFAEGGDRTDAG